MTDRRDTPKFTPGPWKAHCERDFSVVYADGGNIEVCYCEAQFTDDDNRTVAHDATLIAAAPEMYEAIKQTTDYLRIVADVIQRYDANTRKVADTMRGRADALDALLTKARGEKND
ncbi:MAG: hypothetical protein IJS15_01415 [Victivallales bacterium]|nr:hypothetical protein [Victivallales bacterium]